MLIPTVIAVFFLLVAGSIIWYGYRSYVRPGNVFEKLAAPLGGTVDLSYRKAAGYGFRVREALQWFGEKLPQDPMAASLLRRQLMVAGYRSDSALPVFLAIRTLVTVGAGAAAWMLMPLIALPMLIEWGIVLLAAALGHMLTNFGLDILGEQYQEKLRLALPDALDLMVVAVEAGLGLDQAIMKVSEELAYAHPELCRELNLVSMETRAGVKRADALRNMADRTMEKELRKLVAVLVQTDRFGTSVADALRTHAEFMRVRRRQIAEEKANKLPPKLTVVIFFTILPAILIIVGAPAMLMLFRGLMPAISGQSGS
ncbi:MAG: type II secretion system F family protein [Bryobacteraceae bacterium]